MDTATGNKVMHQSETEGTAILPASSMLIFAPSSGIIDMLHSGVLNQAPRNKHEAIQNRFQSTLSSSMATSTSTAVWSGTILTRFRCVQSHYEVESDMSDSETVRVQSDRVCCRDRFLSTFFDKALVDFGIQGTQVVETTLEATPLVTTRLVHPMAVPGSMLQGARCTVGRQGSIYKVWSWKQYRLARVS
jgi:hypothetical protein